MKEFSVFMTLQGLWPKQPAMGHFFEGIQKHMENKNKGKENKIIIGDFNCIMGKMDRDGENKIETLDIPCQNYGEVRTQTPLS